MASTLVQNRGSSTFPIPASFGGGGILPSGRVICGSDPATVSAAFASPPNGNLSFTACQDGQAGALPLLSASQIPAGTAAAITALETAIGGTPVTASQAAAAALAEIFISGIEIGTGSGMNIPHGLGVVPAAVTISPQDTSAISTGKFTVSEGAHTNTNVVLTAVTLGLAFKVTAYA